jgi:hypothetical protein
MILGQLKHAKVHVGRGVEAPTADEDGWAVGSAACVGERAGELFNRKGYIFGRERTGSEHCSPSLPE